MPITLSHSPDRDDEWRVSLDDTTIVCFSGPSARERAVRRGQELADLLRSIAEECGRPLDTATVQFQTPG